VLRDLADRNMAASQRSHVIKNTAALAGVIVCGTCVCHSLKVTERG
jgi:hypothetical protein